MAAHDALRAWFVALACATLAGCGIVAHFTGEDVNDKVRASGLPAEATVLAVSETGMWVNDNPIVALDLEVRAPGRAPWKARAKQLVSVVALPSVQPGTVLEVMYDPADPTRVAVVTEVGKQKAAELPAGPVEITPGLGAERIAEGTWLFSSVKDVPPWGPVQANGLVVVGGREAALVNTAWSDEQTALLIEWLGREGRLYVTTVVATHFHDDCLGGLAAAHAAGARSYALEGTAEMARRNGKAEPDVTFTDRLTLRVGDRALELRYPGPGHTVDNIVAWLPDVRVLFGGCLVRSAEATSLGNTGEADLLRWPDTMLALKDSYPGAVIVVPGHGRPGGRELLNHTLDLLKDTQPAP
jgi:metallo-beta-lactamase class B